MTTTGPSATRRPPGRRDGAHGDHDDRADGTAPWRLPAREWTDVARRVVAEVRDDHLVLSAAGVAFYGFLALIPGLAALLALYGLVSDPTDAARRVEDVLSGAPEQARSLLQEQIRAIADQSGGALSFTLVVSVAVALWAASSGVAHLMEAIGVVHDERDDRGFVRRRGIALLVTVAGVVAAAVAAGLVTALPRLVEEGAGPLRAVVTVLAWAVVAGGFVVGLSVLYRIAPHRRDAAWRWVTPGAVLAMVAWIVASVAFSVYVSRFGSYNETYGSLGAVVVLLVWLYLGALVVLFSAELNAELEHQAPRDTTAGAERPAGRRGAEMADEVAGS